MADKWFIPTLQDVVCDQVRTRYMGDLCPLPAFFEHLYNETSPSCKLRQYFVKKFAVYASSLEKDPARITKTLEQNADFAIDVAKEAFLYPRLCGYGPRQIFKDPDILPACDFHVHGRGQPCPSGKFKPESTTAPRPLTVSFN